MTLTSSTTNYLFNQKLDTDKTYLIFDLETDGLYDKVTTIHCVVIEDLNRQQTFTYGPDDIESALDHLATAHTLIGHNVIFYDCPVIEKLYPTRIPFELKEIIDTLVCSRLIFPKEKLYDLDLDDYPQVPTGLRGSAGLKAWGHRLLDNKLEFKDFSKFTNEMLAYCVQDVAVTHKLLDHIQCQPIAPSALRLEHDFARAIEKQIRSGFQFDVDLACSLIDTLNSRKTSLENKLKEIFPPLEHKEWFTPKVNNTKRGYVKDVPFCKIREEHFNPGSRQQIVDRLRKKYNWEPSKLTEKGNPILDDEVLDKLPYPEAKPLAEYMLLKKRLGQLRDGSNAWLKLVNVDTGCIHGDLNTNGCITGRCSHNRPNMAQVPASYSPYGEQCRALFGPPDDFILLGVDAKALELRCLAGYLAYWDNGEYARVVIDDTIDIHTYNQERFGVETRDISKRLLYAVLYGAGHLKAGTIVDNNEKDEVRLRDLGRTAINSFMEGVPALKTLKTKLASTLVDRGFLLGLDGRPLYCRSEFKALNVLLQAAGAILMKQVVINIHKSLNNKRFIYGVDWHQHAMIHDEIQLSCPPTLVDRITLPVLQAFEDAGNFFTFQCPIAGDAKTGPNWSTTH